MSVLVVGLSHRSAPLEVLERAALRAEDAAALAGRLARSDDLTGALVLATCNRVEVYAAAATFHGALTAVTAGLSEATGVPREELTDHLYVHYEDRAVAHAFRVAAGLDSMAVGETQVLGQLRTAYRAAHARHALGEELGSLVQRALRVGKRVHAQTELDQVSRSLVDAGFDAAVSWLGPIAQARVLVVGAGGMGGLAAATAARHTPAELVVVNRTIQRAQRLADRVGARALPWARLPEALAGADLVVTSTGAAGQLIGAADIVAAQAARPGRRALVDLALPRDVDPAAGRLPDVRLIDLAELADLLAQPGGALPVVLQQAGDLVTAEVAEHLASRAMRSAGPTVAALRARAAQVVEAELARLDAKAPDLDERTRAEVHRALHRVVDKLLHTPTVRAKALAALGDADAERYAAALRELFDLDQADIAALSVPPYLPGERT